MIYNLRLEIGNWKFLTMPIYKRVIKSGWRNFWRTRWVAGATIGVMVVTLTVITSLILISALTTALAENLESKVDISAYFKTDAGEQDILALKTRLESFDEVLSVDYVSRDEALNVFREKHKDNPTLIQSLQEIGSNPLSSSLNIKATDAANYESIANFLEGPAYVGIIDKVNFRQNKVVIEKLSNITATIKRVGFISSIVLAVIAILVTFNTIRLALFNSREEISVMRLVGASNWYIRGPFLVEGALYGIFAAFLTLAVMIPALLYLSPRVNSFLPEIDIFSYFTSNLLILFSIQFLTGVFIGVVSSLIAIRRYLRV